MRRGLHAAHYILHEFIKHPKHTGAIAPSSKILAKKMVDVIDFNKAKCIVELGPGTGFYERDYEEKKKETIFLLIEINEVFFKELKRKFKDEQNVIVVHGSAENIKKYMEELNIECIDYVLSGLPFTSLPEEVSKRILNNAMEAIHENGEFITFQYSLVKKGLYSISS